MTGLQHWAEAYIGRPWVAGEHDCADFVVAVLREQFGLALALPAHDPDDGARDRATSVRGWDRQIAALRADYAEPTDAPQDGDGVLMRARGGAAAAPLSPRALGRPWAARRTSCIARTAPARSCIPSATSRSAPLSWKGFIDGFRPQVAKR